MVPAHETEPYTEAALAKSAIQAGARENLMLMEVRKGSTQGFLVELLLQGMKDVNQRVLIYKTCGVLNSRWQSFKTVMLSRFRGLQIDITLMVP